MQTSVLKVIPAEVPRTPGAALAPASLTTSAAAAGGPSNATLVTPWPLSDTELRKELEPYSSYRILHFTNATKVFGGFDDKAFHEEFDKVLQTRVAYWCCRSPYDSYHLNRTFKVDLVILPPDREKVQGLIPRDVGDRQRKWPL